MPNPYTIVDAINQVVETIGEFPMGGTTRPSAGGDTTSIYWRAETFIDRAMYQVLAQGWPENTERARAFTANGSGLVTVANILSIKATGPDHYRTLVIRNNAGTPTVYDADKRTFNLGASAVVYLDVTVLLTWEDIPVKLADVVVAQAKLLFQRRLQNSQLADSQMQQEYIQSEIRADRNEAKRSDLPPNTQPQFPQAGGGQREQGG
jgi:hypothetical protein